MVPGIWVNREKKPNMAQKDKIRARHSFVSKVMVFDCGFDWNFCFPQNGSTILLVCCTVVIVESLGKALKETALNVK